MRFNLNLFTLATAAFVLFFLELSAQTVPFPQKPPQGEIGPWGYESVGTGWDTSPYLPFLYNQAEEQDIHFRLMPPNEVTMNEDYTWTNSNPGKLYPIILFFHGKGESGNDNNNQLRHGGQRHRDAVLSDEFPGFLLYPQGAEIHEMKALFDKLIEDGLPIDRNRVYVHGLSLGGDRTWNFALTYPEIPAAIWPMSAIVGTTDYTDLIYTPIRLAQGGLDRNPRPEKAQEMVDLIKAQGGHIEMFLLPDNGHGTWNAMYSRSDFFSWFLSHSSNEIFAKGDYYEVCPSDPIDVTLGLNPGNEQYVWAKDGEIIADQTGHELMVTEYGSYTCNIFFDGVETGWSDPMVVAERQPTQTPPITLKSLKSIVLPDPNGNTTVELALPSGYEEYEWFMDGSSVATTQTIAAGPGEYTALVKEQYSCSSLLSEAFLVIQDSGVGLPQAPNEVQAFPLSKTEISITWTVDTENIDGVELYRRLDISDDYELIAVLAPGTIAYEDQNLIPGQKYLYSLRTINANGASSLSEESDATTDSDKILPTVPLNLAVVGTTANSVTLTWEESTDDIGVARYDIYQNGSKALTTTETYLTIYQLSSSSIYQFNVVAVDQAGNNSPMSNRVIVSPVASGLNFKYYEGSWTSLPDFNNLTPVAQGYSDFPDLSERLQNDNFGFIWEGKIQIPDGVTAFETVSDDGSKLYIGGYDETYLVVNNDGLHGAVGQSGSTIAGTGESIASLTPGSYDIAMTFFERTGGQRFEAYWYIDGDRELIPSSAYSETMVIPDEEILSPEDFTALSISTSEIALNWTDVATNEINYQIFRSETGINFAPIALLDANSTSFVDSGLEPETQYYYKLVALGVYGDSDSGFDFKSIINLPLDNSINDFSGNGINSSTVGIVTFDADEMAQGTHAVDFSNANSYIDLDIDDYFIHDSFTERSVAFWIKTSDVSGIQDIFDEGGSTNGYAIRINDGEIEFVVQNNNSTRSISATIEANVWTHIATSFDNGRIELYINGNLEDSHNNVGFSQVSSHSGSAGLGASNSDNAFDEVNNNFNGLIDDLFIYQFALSSSEIDQLISSVVNSSVTSAITSALPLSTDAPDNFQYSFVAEKSIDLTWNTTSAPSYAVFRAIEEPISFQLKAVIGGSATSYIDNSLQFHENYFYVVRSLTSSGFSENSDTLAVSIENRLPELLTSIDDFQLFYDDALNFNIQVDDLDGDTVSIEGINFPEFVSFESTGFNTASLAIEPSITDFGEYSEIVISLDDGFGGITTDTFNIEIIANYAPTIIENLVDQDLLGGELLELTINAEDPNGDGLSWTLDLPDFASYEVSSDGSFVTVTFQPSLSNDGGVYPVSIKVDDDNPVDPMSAETSFELKVTPFDPNHKIYINLGKSAFTQGLPWNDFVFNFPSEGLILNNLINDQGFTLDASVSLFTRWSGADGGTWPGIFPDNVQRNGIYTEEEADTLLLSGLDVNSIYDFELMGSSKLGDDRSSVYEIAGQTASLQAALNIDQSVFISGISPNVDGEIFVIVKKPAGSLAAYLNGIIIEATSSNGVAPIEPTNLVMAFNEDKSGLIFNWEDNSENESGFEIFKSMIDNQNYSSIGSSVENTYTDYDISIGDAYYKVRAINEFGSSGFSNEVFLEYENRAPLITSVNDITIEPVETLDLNIVISDPEGDDFTYNVVGLPSFISSNVTDGNFDLSFTPQIADIGEYLVSFSAIDEFGNSAEMSFKISVPQFAIADTVMVNLGHPRSTLANAPWNNLLTHPLANTSIDLLDTEGNNSNITLTLSEDWKAAERYGQMTGDDSGVYPDVVMQSYYADRTADPKEIVLSGLDLSRGYNLTFFGSRGSIVDDRVTLYSVGEEVVQLNVSNNSSNTASINHIYPNSSGEIRFKVDKAAGTTWKYLNALVINSYIEPQFPIAPSRFSANAISSSRIDLQWSDNSSKEDGFKVYRSTSATGPWTEIASSLSPNTTSFSATNLSSNTKYFFKVAAYNEHGENTTNVVSKTTYMFQALVNFNEENSEALPWNNFDMVPGIGGETVANIIDTEGFPTGINVVLGNGWTSSFPGGYIDNTVEGIYPDNVLLTFYYAESPSVAELKLTGLNFQHTYDVSFLGNWKRAAVTTFATTDMEVIQDNYRNNTQVSTLSNLKPDSNGEIHFEIYGTPSAILSAMEINVFGQGAAAARNLSENVFLNPVQTYIESMYPNPAADWLNIKLGSLKNAENDLTVQLIDIQGKIAFDEKITPNNLLSLNIQDINSGIYLIRIIGSDFILNSKVFIN